MHNRCVVRTVLGYIVDVAAEAAIRLGDFWRTIAFSAKGSTKLFESSSPQRLGFRKVFLNETRLQDPWISPIVVPLFDFISRCS